MSSWWPLVELLSWCPILKSSWYSPETEKHIINSLCMTEKSIIHSLCMTRVKLQPDLFSFWDCFGSHFPSSLLLWSILLTHWGRVTHICISKLTIIGSDNGLSPDWHQAIIWTNVAMLLIAPLGTNFSGILIEIHTFSLKKCIWKCLLENGGHFVAASMCEFLS